jgi:two-component system sensor histidine kinase KdpD
VWITVEARRENVVVRVLDEGPGLSEGELERVFEPFETGMGRDRRGSGLGLAIARGFAEANGGRVWAESESGRGATFGLALPVVRAPVAVGAGP